MSRRPIRASRLRKDYAAQRWTRVSRSSLAMCTRTRAICQRFTRLSSEIIVPMVNDHRRIVGMLDAESEKLNAFDQEDRQFLERAGGLIAHCLH